MQKWEYFMLWGISKPPTQEELNRYGEQGWELVIIIEGAAGEHLPEGFLSYFKRPKN